MTESTHLPAMRPFPPFPSYPLIRKETLVQGTHSSSRSIRPVFRLTFAYPGMLPIDSTTHHLKVIRPGWFYKPRTFTPIINREGEFDLVVKSYEGGSSEWLCALEQGTMVTFLGPIPLAVKPVTYRPGKRAVVVAMGVGITLGLCAVTKEKEAGRSVVLVYAVRYGEEFVFEEELKELDVEVVKVVSGEDVRGCRRGRVDEGVLKECVGEVDKQDVRFLVVGTKAMMRSVWGVIGGMGYGRGNELVRSGF